MYGAKANSTDGSENNKVVQMYQLLDGTPGNISLSNTVLEGPVAAKTAPITAVEFANRRLRLSKKTNVGGAPPGTKLMTAAMQVCQIFSVVTYGGNCNYTVGDMVYVRLCRYEYFITACDSYYPSVGGSGGGGGTNYPPAPPTGTPPPIEPKPDPCTEAKKLAEEILKDLNDPDIKSKIDQLKALAKTSKIEMAFKFGNNTVTREYKSTDIMSGDKSSISYTYSTNGFVEKGSVHLHTLGLDGTPSPGDIYSFYEDVRANSYYLYDLVVWNNDIYMLGIADRDAYSSFIIKYPMSKHYDEKSHGWKQKSVIWRDYYEILNAYNGMYNDKQGALEAAFASVINKYKMGIILQKWNASAGAFKAIKGIDAVKKPEPISGGTSINFGGNNSAYESIEIKGCD